MVNGMIMWMLAVVVAVISKLIINVIKLGPFPILRDLENESVYDVRVQAINRLGSSNYSKVFNFYVKTTRKCNFTETFC